MKSLYYEKNGSIYQVKLDREGLEALLPFNKYLPIDAKTKVWLTKPASNGITKDLVRLVRKQKLEKSYKLFFERVEE
jgi:hypothetical protein